MGKFKLTQKEFEDKIQEFRIAIRSGDPSFLNAQVLENVTILFTKAKEKAFQFKQEKYKWNPQSVADVAHNVLLILAYYQALGATVSKREHTYYAIMQKCAKDNLSTELTAQLVTQFAGETSFAGTATESNLFEMTYCELQTLYYGTGDLAEQRIRYSRMRRSGYADISKIIRGLTEPMSLEQIPETLVRCGKRQYHQLASIPHCNLTADDCLHIAISYRHNSRFNEGGTITPRMAEKIQFLISNRIGDYKGKFRFWVDQNLHRYEKDSDTEWHQIGLLPYALLITVVAHEGEALKERPWIWLESVAATASKNYVAHLDWFHSMKRIFPTNDISYLTRPVITCHSVQDPVYVYLKTLIFAARWTSEMYDFKNYEYIAYFKSFSDWAKLEVLKMIFPGAKTYKSWDQVLPRDAIKFFKRIVIAIAREFSGSESLQPSFPRIINSPKTCKLLIGDSTHNSIPIECLGICQISNDEIEITIDEVSWPAVFKLKDDGWQEVRFERTRKRQWYNEYDKQIPLGVRKAGAVDIISNCNLQDCDWIPLYISKEDLIDLVEPSEDAEKNGIGPFDLVDEFVTIETSRLPKAALKRITQRNLLSNYRNMILNDAVNIEIENEEYGKDLFHRFHGERHAIMKQRRSIHRDKCSPGTLQIFAHASTIEYHYFNGSDVIIITKERSSQALLKSFESRNIGLHDMNKLLSVIDSFSA